MHYNKRVGGRIVQNLDKLPSRERTCREFGPYCAILILSGAFGLYLWQKLTVVPNSVINFPLKH